MVFQQKLLVKPYFFVKMSSVVMVRPASPDFWKAPRVWVKLGALFSSDEEVDICSGYNHPAVVVQPFY